VCAGLGLSGHALDRPWGAVHQSSTSQLHVPKLWPPPHPISWSPKPPLPDLIKSKSCSVDEVPGKKTTEGIWIALPLERLQSWNHVPHTHRKGTRRQQLLEVMREQLFSSDFSPSPSMSSFCSVDLKSGNWKRGDWSLRQGCQLKYGPPREVSISDKQAIFLVQSVQILYGTQL